ncbi:MAG TPA: TonB family protein [Thermoanaerobaculia bacterium]
MKRLLSALLLLGACAQPAPSPQPTPQVLTRPAEEKSIGTVRVTATSLNVRQEASSTAAVVTQVKRGDLLTLLREENGWSKVKLATGEVGWVSSQHVSNPRQRTRKGCPPDSEYSFVKAPLASFSERGPHGLVVVDAMVNTKGDVTSTKVISNSTGDESLAAMAQREIRSAKFTPPYRDCVPRTFIFTYKRSF